MSIRLQNQQGQQKQRSPVRRPKEIDVPGFYPKFENMQFEREPWHSLKPHEWILTIRSLEASKLRMLEGDALYSPWWNPIKVYPVLCIDTGMIFYIKDRKTLSTHRVKVVKI